MQKFLVCLELPYFFSFVRFFFVVWVFFVATTNSSLPLQWLFNTFLHKVKPSLLGPFIFLFCLDWLLFKPSGQLSSHIHLCHSPVLNVLFLLIPFVAENICLTQKVAFYTYILFCTLLFCLTIYPVYDSMLIQSQLTHSFLIAAQYSTVWVYCNFSYRHLSCFQYFVITNNNEKPCVYIFFSYYQRVIFWVNSRCGIARPDDKIPIFFVRYCQILLHSGRTILHSHWLKKNCFTHFSNTSDIECAGFFPLH